MEKIFKFQFLLSFIFQLVWVKQTSEPNRGAGKEEINKYKWKDSCGN